MHPIFVRRSNLLLYLGAWLPALVLLALLLGYSGRFGWSEAFILAAPNAVVYAFLSLSSWYLCKAFPLTRSFPFRLLAVQTAAAALSSGTWVLIGTGLATAMARLPSLSGVDSRFAQQAPLLFAVGVLIYFISASAYYLMAAFENARGAEERSLKMQVLAREAELKLLRSQIDPHFLFNSLNSISALTSIDASRARHMCQLLAGFLRKSLELGGKDLIPLEIELGLARDFLAIEQVRFGARLAVHAEGSAESLTCLVPSLLLQPLVENAVTHGIAQTVQGGEVRIESSIRGERLSIVVANPCDEAAPARRRRGFGLDNTRNRLAALYAREAGLQTRKDGERFVVELTLPATRMR